jgi:hypothetical protein
MRETFTSLIQASQDYVTDPSTSASQVGVSDSRTFFKKEINKCYRDLQAKFSNQLTQRVQTSATVAGQQFYYLPADCHTIEAITVTIAGRKFPIYPVEIDKWLEANRIVFSATAIPTYYIRREKDFGIWPIPQAADQTITLWYNRILKDMSAEDYNTGTVTMVTNTVNVVGSGTTWDATMVGRYFQVANDGSWYRIATVPTPTTLTLENYYAGSSGNTLSYVIGESPEIPEQVHEFIPYKVAAAYYAGPRRDPVTAQAMINYFYTGDFNNASRDPQQVRGGAIYWENWFNGKGRSASAVTDSSSLNTIFFNDQWSTVTSP